MGWILAHLGNRVLNKITMKKMFLISLISNLFGQLGHGRYILKLDLCSGYYQVHRVEGDESKIMCIMRYDTYEFLVILVGLANALASFCTLVNKLFPFIS